MKELEQFKNQFTKLNEELENIDSIGIVRLDNIVKELGTIKESAEEIIRNPGKYTDNVVALSGETVRFIGEVEGSLDSVKASSRQKSAERAKVDDDIKRTNDSIYQNNELLTDAKVRQRVLEDKLKELKDQLSELEARKKVLVDGESFSVKKTSKKDDKKEEVKKEEVKKEEEVKKDKEAVKDKDLVIVEHPSWNIPKFWNPYLTEEQYLEALNRGINEPNGPEYVQYMNEIGLDPNKKAIFWHPLLTEEQILDALQNDIYEPYGPEYNQFLNNLGLSTKYNAVLPKKVTNKFKTVNEEVKDEVVEKKPLNEEPKKEEIKEEVEQPKKRMFVPDPEEELATLDEELNKLGLDPEEEALGLVPEEEEVVEEPKKEEREIETPKHRIEDTFGDDIYEAVLKEPNDTLWKQIKDVLISAAGYLATLVTTLHASKVTKFVSDTTEIERPEKKTLNKKEEELDISLKTPQEYDLANTEEIPLLTDEDIDSLSIPTEYDDDTELEESLGIKR